MQKPTGQLYSTLREGFTQRLRQHDELSVLNRQACAHWFYRDLADHSAGHLAKRGYRSKLYNFFQQLAALRSIEIGKKPKKGKISVSDEEYMNAFIIEGETGLNTLGKALKSPLGDNKYVRALAVHNTLIPNEHGKFRVNYAGNLRWLVYRFRIEPLLKQSAKAEVREAFERFEEEHGELERKEIEARQS